ncbi:unnamed protein product [Paramecium pentaurelia]|uniref:Uncharacterized protein n=1 Tax=Paramecium pentaurelia TaxID=43138 RepID=A0A8S1XK77_9CILI|nr:unnamed protein product [Paramecium pentaurelia]
MELTIYSKQLDLKFDIKINKSKKVREIGLRLLKRFGYSTKTQFSIFNDDQSLELENLIEMYSLSKSSSLQIIFTNKFEITLIHKSLGNKVIIIEAWDQFTEVKHQIQREYELQQSYEVCLKTSKQIYCLEFLIVQEDIHESTNIWWEAYEIIKYEFENKQYQIKIDVFDNWDMIIKQIKQERQINKIIRLNQLISKNIDITEKYYQSKFSPEIIFLIETPEKVILQIAYKETIKSINVKQTATVKDLITIAKVENNLQIKKQFDIYYKGNILQIDQNIQDLNLDWKSHLELIEQKINNIQVQFKNKKFNQLLVIQVNPELQLITVLKEIVNKNCNIYCTDFVILIDQKRIDQNQSFSELNIQNNQIIEYECDSIEIDFIIGSDTLKYHAKKTHTLQSLEQEVKSIYQDLIPSNFTILKNSNYSCNKTLEEIGLINWNVSFTFLPLGKLICEIQFENKIENIECFEYNTVDMLEQIIANKYQIDSKDIQSFYGYLLLNKDQLLKNIIVNTRLNIVMQKKQKIEIILKKIDTDEQQIVKIYIDDPIKLILERQGLKNIQDISLEGQIIDLNSDCQQLQIKPHSILFYRLQQ